ncbi:GTPase domain-containing protein, partial [bacterium]|nr:GTPase domain-containing protein [bacterium]
VDGLVFVVDSQIERVEDNLDSLENLKVNLRSQGYEFNSLPMVLQYNKRDLLNIVPVDELERQLNHRDDPAFESIATEGVGVFDVLRAISKLVLAALSQQQTA